MGPLTERVSSEEDIDLRGLNMANRWKQWVFAEVPRACGTSGSRSGNELLAPLGMLVSTVVHKSSMGKVILLPFLSPLKRRKWTLTPMGVPPEPMGDVYSVCEHACIVLQACLMGE